MTKSSNEILIELVAMADRFDHAGDFDKATKIDSTIKSMAKGRGRPSAPMKGLDEDVKEALVKFLHNVSKRLKASQDDLQELFRRMRYFDQSDSLKPLGLDKAMKDMAETQSCIDSAKERLYSMTFGGGKGGLSKLLEKLEDAGESAGESADDMPNHKPAEFFDSRQPVDDMAKDEPELESIEPKDESESKEEVSPEERDEETEALEEFWKNYEQLESFEDDEETE